MRSPRLSSGRTLTLATLGSAAEREALWKRLCASSTRGGMPAVLENCAPEDREAVPLPGPAGVSFSLWLHTPTGAVSLMRDKAPSRGR